MVKAKESSLASMIISGCWIAVLTILKGIDLIKLEEDDIIYSGVAIAAVFSPVYLSILLDKIKNIKIGGEQ
jgi:hypothetical protein